jgi:hypothetical protein
MNKRFKPFRRLIGSFALALMLSVFAQAIRADEALTERNKAIVRDFYTTVLIGRNVGAAPRFLRPDYTLKAIPEITFPPARKALWTRFVSVSPKNCHLITSANY